MKTIVTNESIHEWYNKPKPGKVYVYYYGDVGGKIMAVGKDEMKMRQDYFTVVWGWPGPDWTDFKFSDYGKTWAFHKYELH